MKPNKPNPNTMNAQSTTRIPIFAQLRWRLTALFLIVAILPIIIITVIVLNQVDIQSRNQVFNQLESVSFLKAKQIEHWIEDGQQQLRFVLLSPILATALENGVGLSPLTANLQQFAETSDIIEEIFFYRPEGTIFLSSNDILVGRVVTRQPYYDASLVAEYIQPPYFDVSSNTLVLVATAPIYNGDELVAVAAIRFNTAELSEIMLERTGLGETGETYLVSKENNYFLTASRFEGYPQNRAYTSLGIEAALRGESGRDVYGDYRNPPTTVLGVYTWLPELEIALMTEIDEAEALSAETQAQTIIITVAIIISAVVAGVGFLLTERLSRPIAQITESASAIARGDFNQRVQLEQRDEIGVLAQSFNGMAEAIQERTKQLQVARDDALAAQRIANENSRLKSEFLATMSHELRTPMNAIEGFTGIMLKRMGGVDYNPKAGDYLTRIQSNSRRLLGLINDFLDLSRIESGRYELAHLPMTPRDMAEKWRENLGVLADNKQLDFYVEVDPNVPQRVYGDEEAVSKIAINLIGNAIKFTEKGEVSVILRKRDADLELVVSDTGIGIPAHARDLIFDEFRQVDQSSKRQHGGTGLGLAIVQKLARAMGGTITVQSQVGIGSTFTVVLPVEAEPEYA